MKKREIIFRWAIYNTPKNDLRWPKQKSIRRVPIDPYEATSVESAIVLNAWLETWTHKYRISNTLNRKRTIWKWLVQTASRLSIPPLLF